MCEHKITVLVENNASDPGFRSEHGLSFWIQWEQQKILFDTGQGQVLTHNAGRLGIRLESVDSIVLSHGHYDHTGGLSDVLRMAGRPRAYTHPQALTPKYTRHADGSVHNIGISKLNEGALISKADLVWTESPMEISAGFWVTGPIPRTNAFEDTGGQFFKDADCGEPDTLLDDQAVFLISKIGTVVILGCAHAGVVNTLHYIRKLTSNRPIHTVMGGMHLLNANPHRMEETITELRRLEIKRLLPCHCTGFEAGERLGREFSDQYESSPAGSVIQIGESENQFREITSR